MEGKTPVVKVIIEGVSEDVLTDLKKGAQVEGMTLNAYLIRALVRVAHSAPEK